MYANGKMRPVETVPGMEGVNSTMIYYKNFGKCHNVCSVQGKKIKINKCVAEFDLKMFY
jgi:hypothetical protein